MLSILLLMAFAASCPARESIPCLLDAAVMSPQQRSEITRVVKADLAKDIEDGQQVVIQISPEHLSKTTNEVVVEGSTGSQNASFYVFSLRNNRAVQILSDGEGTVYQRLKTIHHGMHDLVFAAHVGETESFDQVYQFDGERYKRAYCYSETAKDAGPSADGEQTIDLDGWVEGPHHPCVVNH